MDDHEDDREQSGGGVRKIRRVASRDYRHDSSSRGVKDQAHVEEDDVSELERARAALGKDADRVENKCQSDSRRGDCDHGCPVPLIDGSVIHARNACVNNNPLMFTRGFYFAS